jgi:asparagine synthase (glutamine-hydrolysing)
VLEAGVCGIVGIVDLRGLGRVPSPEIVDAMTDALARRGPDGRGVWCNHDATLGHRRLAIIDPTPAAAQPFVHRERRDVALTYNGEIYNFRALRAELEQRGHGFTTRSDTEVLLAAWLEWGSRCVERLNGIFAFAIVDGKRVFLARDHIGVKPMFYAVHDGVLRFGSEIKAILADPAVPRAPRLEAIDCFLTHAYVPHPLTPFADIHQLAPASTLAAVIGDGREPAIARYWHPSVEERAISFDDALEELRARLHVAVDAQMVADVPLGAFLSGGLDSASIVAEMVKLTRVPVRTFSIGFAQASFDERAGAAETARVLGTQHKADVIDLDLDATVRDVAQTNDDLLADSSFLAVDHLCRMTRREVTVALSGDGADEILAGYDTYAATYAARGWRRVPSPLRRLARRGVERVLRPSTERYSSRDFALRFLGGAEMGAGRDFAAWRSYFNEDDRGQLMRSQLPDSDALGRYARVLDEAGRDATLLKRMLVADLLFYLPNDMLVKVDRASMRHGLEVRVPFLDPTFVDFALGLPSSYLLSLRGEKKRILRAHVASRVSKATARRQKRGFSVPIGQALKGAMHDTLLDAVRSQAFAQDGPLDIAAVERRAIAHKRGEIDATFSLYAVLVMALWWRRFLG